MGWSRPTRPRQVTQQPAYILHSRAYRDTSLILDILSLDYGRVSLLLRGARGARARQGVLAQPFCPFRISWGGRNELRTVHQLEAAGNPLQLKGERLYSGFYVNELLVRLLVSEDPQTHLFAYYQMLLESLQQQDEIIEVLLRRFERQLLGQLGYDIVFTHVQGNGDAIKAAGSYDYVPLDGFIPVTGPVLPETLRIPGQVLLALAVEDYRAGDVRSYAKAISRIALARLLGDRPLKSREFFRSTATESNNTAKSTKEGNIIHD